MAAENPFYVLIASRGDVLVTRIVHSRVYEKDKGNVKNETLVICETSLVKS